jgi:thiol-disulfide isomerase/thioredoxin
MGDIVTRPRVELLSSTAVWMILAGLSLSAPVARSEAQAVRARAVTTFDAAAEIQRQNGPPRIVLLYSSTCPESRTMFPAFVEFAGRYSRRGVPVLAYSVDANRAQLEQYLGAASLPFARIWVQPWQSGGMRAAMTPVGIEIGRTFGTPLIAVIDRNGKVVGQWSGRSGVAKAEQWLRSINVESP